MSRLKRLVELAQKIKAVPNNQESLKSIASGIKKYTNKVVNARGRGIRFIRVNGRIVPVRPKKG